MVRIPKVKRVMTAFPYSTKPSAPLQQAIEFMRSHHIRHLPITEDDEVVGMLSDRDIKLVLGPDFAYPNPDQLTAGDVMQEHCYSVDLDERLDLVLNYMAEHHIGCAAVTRHGKLAGMFTTSDACKAFAEHLRDQFRRSGGNVA
jgi:CBS domain-containing protein